MSLFMTWNRRLLALQLHCVLKALRAVPTSNCFVAERNTVSLRGDVFLGAQAFQSHLAHEDSPV